MKLKFIPYILFFLLAASCQEKGSKPDTIQQEYKPHIIDLSEAEYSEEPQLLSDFVESIGYIKFSEEPLIPDLVFTYPVEDNEGNLYLDSSNGIHKYTPSGQYVKSLFKKGQGPGELASKIGRSIFNIEKNYVLVTDYGKMDYQKFSLNGDFLGTEPYQLETVSKAIFAFWKNTELYSYIRNPPYEQHSKVNPDSLYFFTVRNLDTDSVIFRLKNHHFDIKGEVIGPRIAIQAAPAYRGIISDSLLWVKPVHVDTVFCTTNWKDLRPFYIIKQSPDAADYEWFTICWAGVNNYSTSELLNKKQLSDVWALKNGLLYAYFQGEEKSGHGFCPADGKAKTYSKLFKNDVDKYCPSIDFSIPMNISSLFCKNGYLYMLVDAFKFFEEGAKPPFPDLKEDSNPVLVKLKLKNGKRRYV